VRAAVTVTNNGKERKMYRTYTVEAKQQKKSWEYKLKDSEGSAYNGGNWVKHDDLRT
jgi:hypothetical protein